MAGIPPPSVPPPTHFVPPPLPQGWTEHHAPGGQPYYHHAATNQSTYTRPFPNMPFPIPVSGMPGAMPFLVQNAVIPGAAKGKKKKEKPLVKTSIPGTLWLRVKTTEGNIFYTHKEKKESLWEVPEEIKEEVNLLEEEEKKKEEEERLELLRKEAAEIEAGEEEQRRREQEEVERVKKEVNASTKRKAAGPVEEKESPPKKARMEEEDGDGDGDGVMLEAEEIASERQQSQSPERASSPEGEKLNKRVSKGADAASKAFNVPDRVDLSLDEAKALFKTLLQEKQVNPIHPWDNSLPLFINDPRYVLLPSVATRREAFDEYCRDTLRAQRAAKATVLKDEAIASTSAGDKDKEAYLKLLREEVTSTRTSWHDFKRKWKKDRRFFGWAGDREREKAFRDWLKGLGEEKRRQAHKAEREFFQLLKQYDWINPGDVWKEAKLKINHKDPRYDAVGSSSLREELFNTYIKTLGQASGQASESKDVKPSNEQHEHGTDAESKRKQRAERSLREREAKVRREREQVQRQLGQTRGAVNREEAEQGFMTLLTDAITDPTATWDASFNSLSRDPRYILSTASLPTAVPKDLFISHVSHLRDKYLKMLHALFASHTSSLSTQWIGLEEDVRRAIRKSPPVTKLGLYRDGSDSDSDDMVKRRRSDRDIESEFEKWQRVRNADGRRAFDDMLNENAFIEFWGRMSKAGEGGTVNSAAGIGAEEEAALDEDDQEGEGGGGKADLKKLARGIDVEEVAKVLKNDHRWTVFDHVPEQRERWLRVHMERLSAPKLSVHVSNKDI